MCDDGRDFSFSSDCCASLNLSATSPLHMMTGKVFLRLYPTIFIGLVLLFTSSRAWTTTVPPTRERSPSYSYSLHSSVEETTIPTANYEEAIDATVHLFSLNWTPDECISKPVRDVWKWKDSSLGDGRDFFIPKPKTIQALQDFILRQCPSLSECVVLSNCARLEIVCVTQSFKDPVEDISKALSAQLTSSKTRKRPMYAMLVEHVDLPDLVIDPKALVTCSEESDALAIHWTHLVGVEPVCRHLSLIAAGMALRPRRIDREVPFRPFSSRDAHILLQLKRTKEVANGRRVQQLLDYALRVGKAVRNEDKVPELKKLRMFGSGDSKYSTEPPKELTQRVAKAAVQRALDPLVMECTNSFRAEASSAAISRLRSQAEALAANSDELKLVRQRLHQPTLALRHGSSTVDEYVLLEEMEAELVSRRDKV